MPIVLFRVDERLIHGQVVVGWGAHLGIERIVVIDDDISQSSWEQDLYCAGVPAEMRASFVSVEEARRSFDSWKGAPERIVLLVRDIGTLRRLAEGSLLEGQEVSLGGIHHAPGRERLLPYLFLNAREREELAELRAAGITIAARDLPGSRAVPLQDLLDRTAP